MNLTKKTSFLIVVASLLSITIPSYSAPLSLETTPLFTTNSAKPNLILSIDDSGSMDAESLFNSNDGALWWNTTNNSFVDSTGAENFNESGRANGTWKKYIYLFPNGTGTGKRVYNDASNNHFAIPPIKQYAYTRSAEYNKMYYNPNDTYEPWTDYAVETASPKIYGNISITAAPSDPITGTSSTLDLTSDRYLTGSNQTFKMYSGMKIPTGTYYNGTTATADTSVTGNVKIRYFPATYYIKKSTGVFTVGTGSAGDCSSPNPTLYTTFHNSPSSLSGTNIDSLSPNGSCLTKIEIKPTTTEYSYSGDRSDCAGATCTYDEEIQNFANWYGYYRKRHLALRAGMGQAFVGFNAIRTGIFTINNMSNVTMWDMANSSNNNSFYNKLYNIDGNSGGTPNRSAMDYAGKQFMRTGSGAPITESCQKNFTLFFTDGFANLETISGVGNQDGGKGQPYEDSYSSTIADIALKYYNTNLRPGLTSGDVSPDSGCNSTPLDQSLDCNTNLHMNTYTIGLGAKGKSVYGISHFNVADAYANPPTWPNTTGTRNATQVDDLYHAAVNGRGEMFNAASASDLQTQLRAALLGIQASNGSGSAVSFNTSTLETNSALYYASFNSANWSGDLASLEVSTTGTVSSTASWKAAEELNAMSPTSRVIITHNGTNGIPFRWNTSVLSVSQQADLNAAADNNGENALNFIRGSRLNEGIGKYRIRSSVMGDIIHSSPVYVGVPELKWPSEAPFPTAVGTRYSDFRAGLLADPREPVVYTGANDGMLHGFKASDGEELLAYIPNFLYSSDASSGLHYLTNPKYSHKYYVDLAPTVSDVYIDTDNSGTANWHSILIGGGGAGGRGLFALDITDPDQFSEVNADDIALWEFTDPDLGYTYSKPTIVQLSTGKWAAIFGNGYNDTGTGQAKLFILYLDGGLDGTWTPTTDYQVISTGIGSTTTPNGLATPAIIDIEGDGVADRAYAGDLQGNLWVFDLTTTPATIVNSAPLFTAKDDNDKPQPITSKPIIAFHPEPPSNPGDPNVLVFFGTGQYLQVDDLSNTDTQSFYGVWDDGNDSLDRTNLVEQTISESALFDSDGNSLTADTSGNSLRIVSDNTVNYNNKHGWYMDLPTSGERVVVNPKIRGSLVFFNTTIPSTDPCGSGGSGYLMSVEMLNGGEPDEIAFNVDGINGITEADYVYDADGNRHAAAGQKFDSGLPSESTFRGNNQFTTSSDTGDSENWEGTGGGGDQRNRELANVSSGDGRLSWKELW